MALQATVNDKTVGDFNVETAFHPDGKDWSLISATITSDDACEKEKVHFAIKTLLQGFLDDPASWQHYFFKVRKRNSYIKTPFLRNPLNKNHELLNVLIEALSAKDFLIALQLYPGHDNVSLLTSIHQDGVNGLLDCLLQLVLRLCGETAFFKSSSENSLFYSAHANNKMRATLAMENAFCGQCADGSNNGVHHAGRKGVANLPFNLVSGHATQRQVCQ
jgi:hypothetical protein